MPVSLTFVISSIDANAKKQFSEQPPVLVASTQKHKSDIGILNRPLTNKGHSRKKQVESSHMLYYKNEYKKKGKDSHNSEEFAQPYSAHHKDTLFNRFN